MVRCGTEGGRGGGNICGALVGWPGQNRPHHGAGRGRHLSATALSSRRRTTSVAAAAFPRPAPPRLAAAPLDPAASAANGSFVYLSYPPDARSAQPQPPRALTAAGSFGKKMTMDDLIARQIWVTARGASLAGVVQPRPANAFQLRLGRRRHQAAGFLYGVDTETKEVMVDFIYEVAAEGPRRGPLMRTPTRRSA
ncbi:hypothetical protein ZWY2020_057364 [Hordeum vulgare]|nr:hypothetical protein ZWY2020_057364 [Hordeum vulgare]